MVRNFGFLVYCIKLFFMIRMGCVVLGGVKIGSGGYVDVDREGCSDLVGGGRVVFYLEFVFRFMIVLF